VARQAMLRCKVELLRFQHLRSQAAVIMLGYAIMHVALPLILAVDDEDTDPWVNRISMDWRLQTGQSTCLYVAAAVAAFITVATSCLLRQWRHFGNAVRLQEVCMFKAFEEMCGQKVWCPPKDAVADDDADGIMCRALLIGIVLPGVLAITVLIAPLRVAYLALVFLELNQLFSIMHLLGGSWLFGDTDAELLQSKQMMKRTSNMIVFRFISTGLLPFAIFVMAKPKLLRQLSLQMAWSLQSPLLADGSPEHLQAAMIVQALYITGQCVSLLVSRAQGEDSPDTTQIEEFAAPVVGAMIVLILCHGQMKSLSSLGFKRKRD